MKIWLEHEGRGYVDGRVKAANKKMAELGLIPCFTEGSSIEDKEDKKRDPSTEKPSSSTSSSSSSSSTGESSSPSSSSSSLTKRTKIESYELDGKIHVGVKGPRGERGIEGPPGPVGLGGVCMCSTCSKEVDMTRDEWISSMKKSVRSRTEEDEIEYGCEESLKTYVDNLIEKLEREGYKVDIKFALNGRDGDVGPMGEPGRTGSRGMPAVCTAPAWR